MDFWTAKSKYGTTIQDALDWAMSADPKNENVLDIIPHVAAVAAAGLPLHGLTSQRSTLDDVFLAGSASSPA